MRSSFRRWLPAAAALVLAPLLAGATTQVPTEEFARLEDFSDMRLSPDGKFLAFLRTEAGKSGLYFLEIDGMKPARIDHGNFPRTDIPIEAIAPRWISDTRVFYDNVMQDEYFVGQSAVNRDGGRPKRLTGTLVAYLDDNPLITWDIVAVLPGGDAVLLNDNTKSRGGEHRPNVVKVDAFSGKYETVVRNPGDVLWWETDRHGVVRLGFTEKSEVLYRESATAEWRKLPPVPAARGNIAPLHVSDDGVADVVALTDKGRWTVFRYNVADGSFSAPLAEDDTYDFVPRGALRIEARVAYSTKKSALVGIHYTKEASKTHWLDPEYAAYQASLDKALPGKVNQIQGISRDGKQMLVFSYSDRDPGSYYRFDTAKPELRFIAKAMSRIKPDEMASMFPIKYAARDGVTIHGYLTAPNGVKPENLPLVVMPHGGPWARDEWRFDPLVQLLANRGYAVLQMNFRGSLGYGDEFYRKGRREFGGAAQHDIEDGTRWAIRQGFADPKRIAIVGASFGGYAALFGLGKTPDLYRCGIAECAVTDWAEIIKDTDKDEYRRAHTFWVDQLGDPKDDRAALDAISPVHFAKEIKAPVLFIHGREDQRVPIRQARKMVSALEAAGQKPETLYFAGEYHGIVGEKNRVEYFKRIETFLAQHMGAAK